MSEKIQEAEKLAMKTSDHLLEKRELQRQLDKTMLERDRMLRELNLATESSVSLTRTKSADRPAPPEASALTVQELEVKEDGSNDGADGLEVHDLDDIPGMNEVPATDIDYYEDFDDDADDEEDDDEQKLQNEIDRINLAISQTAF